MRREGGYQEWPKVYFVSFAFLLAEDLLHLARRKEQLTFNILKSNDEIPGFKCELMWIKGRESLKAERLMQTGLTEAPEVALI